MLGFLRHFPRSLVRIVMLVMGAGVIIWCAGAVQPVYTEAGAPERLTNELNNGPTKGRSKEWNERLRALETSHKFLTDLGRGVISGGIGLWLAMVIGRGYRRSVERGLGWVFFMGVWTGLWAIKVPFTYWYYGLRQRRFDYPIWADSIGIPIMSECMAWVVCGLLSAVVAGLLMLGHRWEPGLALRRPVPVGVGVGAGAVAIAWGRALLLWGWLVLVVYLVAESVLDGDEGMVISCMGAVPLLLALLSASRQQAALPEARVEAHPV